MKNKRDRAISSGYTLVELSVVLVIVSLLTAGGLTLGAGMVNQAAHVDTGKILSQIDQSLRDYYAVNGRLPCPASRTLAITNAEFGREINNGACDSTSTAGAYAGTAYSNDVRIGMVPARTLGLSDRAASDKYGNRILYAVSQKLTDASLFGAEDGKVQVMPVSGAAILTDAAYFLWSAGKDHKGAPLYATAATATTCGSSTNLDVENCDDDNVFRDAPFNNGDVAASFFDDQTRWVAKFHLAAMTSSSDSLWAANGDANLFSVGTDGNTNNTNVGIGTDVPAYNLDVNGFINSTSQIMTSDQPTIWFHDTDSGARTAALHTNSNHFYVLRDNGADWAAFGTQRPFTIDLDTSYVGIGTHDPQKPLHVMGDVLADQGTLQARGSSGSVYLMDTTAGEYSAGIQANLNKLYFLRAPTNSTAYDSSRPLTVDLANERVGVNTSSPGVTLDVNGDARITNTLYSTNGRWVQFISPPSHVSFLIPGFGGGTSPGAYTDMPTTWGGGLATWDIVGAQTLFNGYITRSDLRLKRDVHAIDAAENIKKLRLLQPVSYLWKDEKMPEQLQYGFIAQDVQKIWPELITGEETETTYLGLNYDGLFAPLVAATQSLLETQELLKAENADLKARLEALEAKVSNASGAAAANASGGKLTNFYLFLLGAGVMAMMAWLLRRRR